MAKGTLQIPLTGRQHFVVTGGPFRECPDTMWGVKMAAEIEKPCAVDIPTRDFHVPDRLLLYRGLEKAVDLVLAGDPIYVGCMGGIGRTGLFLAILAKAFGVKQPVKFVRAGYYAHAVETPEQQTYVKAFKVNPRVRAKIKQARRQARWYFWTPVFWKSNLTRLPEEKVITRENHDDPIDGVIEQLERS